MNSTNAESVRQDATDDRTSGDSTDRASRTAAARVRERGERVRQQELATALRRLAAEADGEVSPADRRVLAALSVRLADALVERWASNLDDGVDADAALELLSE